MNSSALDLRPAKWSEVIGHASVVASLRNLLAQATPSVIGFSGAPGSGKTTLALILAKELGAVDIKHLNCADANGVDDARGLAEDAMHRPLTGTCKVRILDECHMMTVQAQNALLLPTEPQGKPTTLWIFCTTEPDKMLPALKSRGAWYDLKPFGETEIRELYDRLSVQKMDDFPEELFQEVLRKGLDNPRALLYAYDKFSSGCSAEESVQGNGEEVEYTEIARAALRSWPEVAPLLKALKPSDAKPLRRLLSSWMRSVLLSTPAKAQACSELLVRFATQESFEDSMLLAAVCADIYLFTQKKP